MTRQELCRTFSEQFEAAPSLEVVSPGRTELAGNHTDHEDGHVIAAAVDRAVHGLAVQNGTEAIRLLSLGFGEVEVSLRDLAAREGEHGSTSALVRGMAALFTERGFVPAGFDVALCSDVLGGSGLSSSAAFELAMGQAMNALWANGVLTADELALMALLDAVCHVLDAWRAWDAPEVGVVACEPDGTRHNTVTPICRRRGDAYELDLALRCNVTTAEHPLGVFHPHEDKWHIKKENIGLIEVMGLAILPPRLEAEMEAGRLTRDEIGRVFGAVLEDAGVFKWDEAGRAALGCFIASL